MKNDLIIFILLNSALPPGIGDESAFVCANYPIRPSFPFKALEAGIAVDD